MSHIRKTEAVRPFADLRRLCSLHQKTILLKLLSFVLAIFIACRSISYSFDREGRSFSAGMNRA
jgi:hypothetical protein